MAIDLTTVSIFPHYKKITAVTTATEIKLPPAASIVEIANWNSTAVDVYVAQNNQSDGAAFDTDYMFPVPYKNAKKIILARSLQRADSLYIASASGSIDVYIEIVDN